MSASLAAPDAVDEAFRHEALLYSGDADFVAQTASFLRDGVAVGEPALVVVSAAKIAMLREELGAAADAVHFADMADVGRNPARIIPAWEDFVAACARRGVPFRGVGEPIWPSRSPAELAECERHEALLNLAFARAPAWWLLCPYDVEALDPVVIEGAERNHPLVMHGQTSRPSGRYDDLLDGLFDEPLPEPAGRPEDLAFDLAALETVRLEVAGQAAAFGLSPGRAADFVLAAHEIATNSVRYGGGRGSMRIWPDGDALLCEIRDGGRVYEPLIGRRRPASEQENGRGLWMANQLCDLVQIRSSSEGTVVRLHMSRH